MAKFWWGNGEDGRRIHWMKWEQICQVKGKGGLGFRELQHFNTALLAKQIWRLITHPNLLASKILKTRYLKSSNIWDVKGKKTDSWLWKNLLSGREVLENGIRWRIGDGKKVRIWDDKWLPDKEYGKVKTIGPVNGHKQRVNELITDNQWDLNKLRNILLEDDIQKILKIPVSLLGGKDKLFWMHSPSGAYTVKSGYALAKDMGTFKAKGKEHTGTTSKNTEGDKGWKLLWSLNVKHKLKHFIWKALHNILPVNDMVFSRVRKGEAICMCCGEGIETVEHVFFWCQNAQKIWKIAPIQWDGLQHLRHNFWLWWKELTEAVTRVDGKDHIILTINILWQIWKARNEWNFQRKRKVELQVINKAVEEWWEFKEGNSKEVSTKEQHVLLDSGKRTGEGNILIYTDAALQQTRNKAGGGIVARKDSGEMIACWAVPKHFCSESALEEALTIRLALMKAKEEG